MEDWPASHRLPTRVIIDTDAGIDDAVALAVAARSPEIALTLVTSSFGNAPLPCTTRNARVALALSGREDVTVSPGAPEPWRRPSQPPDGARMHGPSGVGGAPVGPPARVAGRKDALAAALRSMVAPVTLVTLGPLTNLANALLQDESLVRARVARHVGVFGTWPDRGVRETLADFNARADPLSARRVVEAGLPTVAIPLETVRAQRVCLDDRQLVAHSDPLVRWLGAALRSYTDTHRRYRRVDGTYLGDVLAIVEAATSSCVSVPVRNVSVDLDGHITATHRRGFSTGGTIRMARSVPRTVFEAMLSRVLPVGTFEVKEDQR